MAREPPFAVCVVVWREGAGGREFLVLHRLAPGGADYEGEWAWTPPSGARLPWEEPHEAARRELFEETSLALDLMPAPEGRATQDVALYVAQAGMADEIRLDAEHDRFAWLSLESALERCLPPVVAQGLANAATWLDAAPEPRPRPSRNRHELGTEPRRNSR